MNLIGAMVGQVQIRIKVEKVTFLSMFFFVKRKIGRDVVIVLPALPAASAASAKITELVSRDTGN